MSPLPFSDPDWWARYLQVLNADAEWSASARLISARIGFVSDGGAWSVDTRDGVAVSYSEGLSPVGDDIVVTAPDEEWIRVLSGETDWFQGTSPGLGQVEVSGDAVMAMRNVKPMWLLLRAMSRVDQETQAVAYCPDPQWSDRPIVGRYIEVDGMRVHIEEAGSGPTIYCIHAAGQDSLMYRYVLDALSDSYHIVAVDAPGHGKTEEPATGAFSSITQFAEFNERVMDALGLNNPIILGCSMGGNMVLELAARDSARYAGVVSCEGSDYTPTVSQFLLDMLRLNHNQILECWSRSLTGVRTPPQRAREVVWQLTRVTPDQIIGDLTGYTGFDKRAEMSQVSVPVVLLRGEADWLVPQDSVEASASRIAGSEIVVLDGTGHYPMIENPVEFCDAIRQFAQRVWPNVR
jgi:pimeloyl-ACP methyl ester carboxylesterase/putative sterol carrier protein